MKQPLSALIGSDGELLEDAHVPWQRRLFPYILLALLLTGIGLLVAVAVYFMGNELPFLRSALPATPTPSFTLEVGSYQPSFALDYSIEQQGLCHERMVSGQVGGDAAVSIRLVSGDHVLAEQAVSSDRSFSITMSGIGSNVFDVLLVNAQQKVVASLTDVRLDGVTTHSCKLNVTFSSMRIHLTN